MGENQGRLLSLLCVQWMEGPHRVVSVATAEEILALGGGALSLGFRTAVLGGNVGCIFLAAWLEYSSALRDKGEGIQALIPEIPGFSRK